MGRLFDARRSNVACARVGPERFSAEFPFRLGITVILEAYTPLHLSDYHHAAKAVPLFHSSCFKFRPFTISDDFLAVTEHSIQLSKMEEHQRFKRIQRLLAPRIYHLLSVRLPFELVTMISGHLVRECAMVTAKDQSLFSQASDTLVDLSRDVYASYSVLDGVRYVKSLCNLDTDEVGEYHRILNAEEQSYVDRISICEDHLGISAAPVVKGWWRDVPKTDFTITVEQGKFSGIHLTSDGIKLRDITNTLRSTFTQYTRHISWPSPEYPSHRADLMPYTYTPPLKMPLSWNVRMTYFDCNASGATGYTMVSQGHWLSTIHTHGQGSDAEFYKEADACFRDQVLIYMPVDRGEYITEIRRRFGNRSPAQNSIDLMFLTNRGRCTVFGPEKAHLPCVVMDRMMKPSQHGSRIYFNKVGPENDTFIRRIACDEEFERPLQRSTLVNSQVDPSVRDENPWFASRCGLQDVKEVTVCRDVSVPHKPIIGMLIQYLDGHRDRLGQFRFDRALETTQAERSRGLYIGLQRMPDTTYVADVRAFPPEDPGKLSWVEASWSGTLEWKFKRADCAVIYIPPRD
ncbi:hypothetical protein ACHAPT_003954 [Fusarium lateritium]